MRKIINTNIRLNLENTADREAWEHLQNLDRSKYKSYTKAVIAAVNAYFGKVEEIEADPYLETREKEDAFLDRIIVTIEQALKASSSVNAAGGLLQLLVSNVTQSAEQSVDNNSLDDALDFTDNF